MEVSQLTFGAGRKQSLGNGREFYVPTVEKWSHIHLIISVIRFKDRDPKEKVVGLNWPVRSHENAWTQTPLYFKED